MTKKMIAVVVMALALFAIVACSPQTADSPPEEAAVEQEPVEQVAVEEAPTTAPVAEEPATPTSAPTDTPVVEEPTEVPEEVVEVEAEAEEMVEDDQPDDAAMAEAAPVQFGRTEEGAFFYGSPDAEIVLIDHSDFL